MGLTENLTLLRAGEREALAGTGDGHISKPPLLLHGCRVAHGVHMGEQGLLHASHPNAVELKALGGVHGHKGDGLTVLGHRIQVGAQANPFQKIGQRIAAQHAHRLDRLIFAHCRRGEIGLVRVVGLHELVHNAQKLLNVLDAPAGLVGALVLQCANEARVIDDHLHHLAQITLVGGTVLDDLDELPHRVARGGADVRIDDGELSRREKRHIHLASELVDALDGGLADAATGHINDALGGDVVGRVHHQREVGHDVADLGAVEKARAADDAVGHPGAQKHIFKHARLGVGAVEDGHVVVGGALSSTPVDLASDPAALVALVGSHVHRDLLAVARIRKQALLFAMLVVGDDGVGRSQDIAHAAVVLLQLHHLGFRIVAFELQNIAQIGAAPRINGLVVVAHHHDVATLGGEQLGDGVLGAVGVLVLVHHEIAEAVLVGLAHVLVILQQQVAVEQKVVEIEGVGRAQPLLQTLVDALSHLAHGVAGREIARSDQVVLRLGDAVHQLVDGEALRVDVQLGHDFFVQPLHIVGVVDGEVLCEAQPLGVGAQHAHAHRVEGGHPHAPRARAHELRQTLAHLGGRLVGEGDGEDLPRGRQVLLQDVGDAVGEHPRLAGTGAGQHQKRTFRSHNRLALRAV